MYKKLSDYRINFRCVMIKCDNTSTINLTKSLAFHSPKKHIEIQHHFIKDHVEKGDCVIEFMSSSNQLRYFFYQASF